MRDQHGDIIFFHDYSNTEKDLTELIKKQDIEDMLFYTSPDDFDDINDYTQPMLQEER